MKKIFVFYLAALSIIITGCTDEKYIDSLGYTGEKDTTDFRDEFAGIYKVKCQSEYSNGKGYIRILKGYDSNSLYIVKVYEKYDLDITGLETNEDGVAAEIYLNEEDSTFTIETTYFPDQVSNYAAWQGSGYFKKDSIYYKYLDGKPNNKYSDWCTCEGEKTLKIY